MSKIYTLQECIDDMRAASAARDMNAGQELLNRKVQCRCGHVAVFSALIQPMQDGRGLNFKQDCPACQEKPNKMMQHFFKKQIMSDRWAGAAEIGPDSPYARMLNEKTTRPHTNPAQKSAAIQMFFRGVVIIIILLLMALAAWLPTLSAWFWVLSAPLLLYTFLVLRMFIPGVRKASRTASDEARPYLTHPEHYEQTSRQAPGDRCDLKLIQASVEGERVALVYQWSAPLADKDADKLDTRARAYIACAIYDAAAAASLSCQAGPPHGQRPSWLIEGERMPISLVEAGFDLSDKTCFMLIGAGVITRRESDGGGGHLKMLLAGFKARFSEIHV